MVQQRRPRTHANVVAVDHAPATVGRVHVVRRDQTEQTLRGQDLVPVFTLADDAHARTRVELRHRVVVVAGSAAHVHIVARHLSDRDDVGGSWFFAAQRRGTGDRDDQATEQTYRENVGVVLCGHGTILRD